MSDTGLINLLTNITQWKDAIINAQPLDDLNKIEIVFTMLDFTNV